MTNQSLDRLFGGRGICFLGCGNMGFALLSGILDRGVELSQITVLDPNPGGHLEALASAGMGLNQAPAVPPAVCLIAVKPQVLADALPQVKPFAEEGTLFVSVAAGVALEQLSQALGSAAVVRSMPNTPAAVGAGVTALVANAACRPADRWLAEGLMQSVGHTVWLETEDQMDAVTAVSGSGPAYVFLMIEALAAAGMAQGLPRELAEELALRTVAGAGQLASEDGSEPPAVLRANVTSPGGTTAAALSRLMDEAALAALMAEAVAAAAARSRELGEDIARQLSPNP